MRDNTKEPNDPTRSGSPLPATGSATLSRNEINALCLKAARGAGMSWGMAEEAGFAASWLAAHGLDGPAALLAQLHRIAGLDWQQICPVIGDGVWRPADNSTALCPIALGATLSDYAMLPEAPLGKAGLQIGPVSQPSLLMPFLAMVASNRGETIELDWQGTRASVTPNGDLEGDVTALMRADTLEAVLTAHKASTPTMNRPKSTAHLPVNTATLRGLNDLAMRTTVPSSEGSRADAGAATSDND